tara:strand:- start:89 stop:352 length:264 start_codon:yes stop_codon:yes gene_type:complete
MFNNINYPESNEIKVWLSEVNLTIRQASIELGISTRQLSRFLSGESKAKRIHALAMQMVWLISENKKDIEKSKVTSKKENAIKIPIK